MCHVELKKFCCWFSLPLLLLAGCSEDPPDPEYTVFPDNEYFFSYAPNDMAANDSVSANLAHGVKLSVHPNASYELSFKKDPSVSEIPILQLFHLYLNEDSTAYYGKKIRTLEPKEINGRYVYNFICEERDNAEWATSLSVETSFYRGRTDSVRFIGSGAYSDHFSLNLVVVGKHTLTSDSVDVEGIAQKTLEAFRKYYTSVHIDTIYIRYADKHPTLGKKYPANEPWLAGKSSEDMFLYELGGWPEDGVREALDIVYVYRIEREMTIGYASLFSGNLGGGAFSTVLVGNYVMSSEGARSERLLSSAEIVETILHETGHFFGLRHTSATRRDLKGDMSNIEDGLTDTPFCGYFLTSTLYKQSGRSDFVSSGCRENCAISRNDPIYACPDLDNIMFPVTVDCNEGASFTNQQMEIIRSSLMIFPH